MYGDEGNGDDDQMEYDSDDRSPSATPPPQKKSQRSKKLDQMIAQAHAHPVDVS